MAVVSQPIIPLLLAVLFAVPSDADSERKSLQLVKDLGVQIEDLPEAIESVGLTVPQIRTDVELRPRLAKIDVVDTSENTLYINVGGVSAESGPVAYTVSADFLQQALLKSEAAVVQLLSEDGDRFCYFWDSIYIGKKLMIDAKSRAELAFISVSTWSAGMVGIVGRARDPRETIRAAVRDQVDAFVNDLLAARTEQEKFQKQLEESMPKKEGAATPPN